LLDLVSGSTSGLDSIADIGGPTYERLQWPILLKNSVSADVGKNPAPVGCEGRGKLGAYREELMSRCRAYSLLQQRTMDQILDQIRI
jgi:hypothetical protein